MRRALAHEVAPPAPTVLDRVPVHAVSGPVRAVQYSSPRRLTRAGSFLTQAAEPAHAQEQQNCEALEMGGPQAQSQALGESISWSRQGTHAMPGRMAGLLDAKRSGFGTIGLLGLSSARRAHRSSAFPSPRASLRRVHLSIFCTIPQPVSRCPTSAQSLPTCPLCTLPPSPVRTVDRIPCALARSRGKLL